MPLSWQTLLPRFYSYAMTGHASPHNPSRDSAQTHEPHNHTCGLHFGTAGMRAPVGPAEGHMNVLQVTRISAGLASWLAAHTSQELSQERQDDQSHPLPDSVFSSDVTPSVVIGYDARYGSHIFATTTAEVCAGAGFEVTRHLTTGTRSTLATARRSPASTNPVSKPP